MNMIDFYINKFANIEALENTDLSFIPPILKRKLSNLNRATFYTLNNCFSENTEALFYASQYGEFDKLLKIIEQYNTQGEVSPTLFSSSVHNSTIGAFASLNKISVPYFALAATSNTLSMGLLTSLISQQNNVVFCYADYMKDEAKSIALSYSKKNVGGQHCILTLCDNTVQREVCEYELLKDFLEQQTDTVTFANYKIERVTNA